MALAHVKSRRPEMQTMVEITTILTGIAVGLGAGRLFLEGILTATFGKPHK